MLKIDIVMVMKLIVFLDDILYGIDFMSLDKMIIFKVLV
jgi:hypothetical protein